MTPLTEIEALLYRTIGLDSTTVGSSSVERAVRDRMAVTATDSVETYWRTLCGSDEELRELIETVVVPETWFFRDAGAFHAMTSLLAEQRQTGRHSDRVRLLSIPCSTGEEPYSMVMALLDADFPREEIKVDAVDISGRSLAKARRGIYCGNSFRAENLEFRDRYFQVTPQGYSLTERLGKTVTFDVGNLVVNQFPRAGAPYDVVFCRNLLIYFDRATQAAALKILDSLLAPSGLLFVGPAEAYLAASNGFRPVSRAMSFAFRKSPIEKSRTTETPGVPTAEALANSRRLGEPKLLRPSLAEESVRGLKPPVATAAVRLAEAERLADLGRLAEAIDQCQRILEENGPSVEAYYLLGIVRDAMGDRKAAADYYKRVVYLNPRHVDALIHLALLIETDGDSTGARRLRERARRTSDGVSVKGSA